MATLKFNIFRPDNRLALHIMRAGIVAALALAVMILRLHRLDEAPLGIDQDEAAHTVDALRVLQGEHAPFFPGNLGREGMIVYAVALTTSLVGPSVLALRLPTAMASMATVFVVLWLGHLLFGRDEGRQATPWRALVIGAIGAGLLAVSSDNNSIGRQAFRAGFVPLFLCLSMALLWEGWRRMSWRWIVLAGVCTGLLAYTYSAAQFAPVLFLLFGLSFFLPWRTVSRERVRAAAPWISVFIVVACLVAVPILVYAALDPTHFFKRTDQLWTSLPDKRQKDLLGALWENLWRHRYAFDLRPGGMLRPWEAIFFFLGVAVSLRRWKEGPAYRLLLLWVAVMLLPSVLAWPSYRRQIGAVPAVYLLAGVGMWEAFRLVHNRLPVRISSLGALAAGGVVAALFAGQGALVYQRYFNAWETVVPSDLDPSRGMAWNELAQSLNARPPEPTTVYLVPTFQLNWLIVYLYRNAAPLHTFHPGKPDLVQQIRAALTADGGVAIVKIVQWEPSAAWMGKDSGQLSVLFSKYGRHQGKEAHAMFRIHSYTGLDLERTWKFYDRLEPPAVEYDGGISLHGLALGQGPEQIVAEQALELERDRPVWLAMQWQVKAGLNVDYSASLRLYEAAKGRVFQEDTVLRNRTQWPTSSWAVQPVDTLHLFEVPPDLPPGLYELRLVVYDFETQVPTVEIGTWQPEVTLAHLQVGGGR